MTSSSPLPFVYGKRPSDLDVLSRSQLLRGLGIRDVGTFFDLLDQVALPRGTTVVREGEAGEYMYFVLEGSGRLCRGQLELRAVGPGDHFGELALLGDRPRPSTVEAHTTMRLARLSRSRYRALATSHPRLALHFTQALASTLGEEVISFTDRVGLLLHQRSAPRRLSVHVRRASDEVHVSTGTLVGTLLPREHEGSLVVAATVNRTPAGLEAALVSDVELAPLTLSSWEGREIYLRSAALVLLEAARRVAPSVSLRIGPAVENGQVIVVKTAVDRAALVAALTAEVHALIREDLPLREEIWSVDEGRVDLAARGAPEAASLLSNARDSTASVACCGETFATGMGPLLPRASYLGAFALVVHPSGLLLRLEELDRYMPVKHGARVDPAMADTSTPRHAGEMALASQQWLEGLGVTSVGSFDRHCVSGRVPDLIRVAEGFHEKWIGRVADMIAARRDVLKVIAIAGPSSSGKTTFIKRLTVQLLVDGVRPLAISLDDYYVDRERTARDESGDYDFEALEALDLDLLRGHARRLLAGEEVVTARYDFVTGKSLPDGGRTLAMRPGDVLLLEGIHGLNPLLFGGVVPSEAMFRIFVHPAQSLAFDRLSVLAPEDVRLLRRLVRDRHQRNASAAETLTRWPSVRRGELLHIFPFLGNADVVFDSSLVYELSVLKTYAERYLLEVPPSHPGFTTAYRLRRLIDQFVAIHPDHVPPTSVIREFIGGSGFEY